VITPTGIKPVTFQFQVQCLNLMHHLMPPNRISY